MCFFFFLCFLGKKRVSWEFCCRYLIYFSVVALSLTSSKLWLWSRKKAAIDYKLVEVLGKEHPHLQVNASKFKSPILVVVIHKEWLQDCRLFRLSLYKPEMMFYSTKIRSEFKIQCSEFCWENMSAIPVGFLQSWKHNGLNGYKT